MRNYFLITVLTKFEWVQNDVEKKWEVTNDEIYEIGQNKRPQTS